MSIALTILPDERTLHVEPGVTVLKAAHGAGVDITATCGGRGRCTSCRVKFVSGTIPPPTIMDELQLGDGLVRDALREHLRRLSVLDKERRDRAGYARRPIAEDEFGVWDKVTAWPED